MDRNAEDQSDFLVVRRYDDFRAPVATASRGLRARDKSAAPTGISHLDLHDMGRGRRRDTLCRHDKPTFGGLTDVR